jgi:twinkle protein
MSVVNFNTVSLPADLGDYVAIQESQAVRPASHYVRRIIDEIAGAVERPRTTAMPWPKLQGLFALRPGEMTVWTGHAGHGKSMMLGEVCLLSMAQGERVFIISPEFHPQRVVERMLCQSSVQDGIERVSLQFAKHWANWAHDRLWLLEQRGLLNPDRVIGALRYCYDEFGITQAVVDSLMMCGIAEDDNERMRPFMDRLHATAVQTGIHLHLVAHARKRDDDSRPAGLQDIKGVSTIGDMAENVVSVWRNKRKKEDEADAPDALFVCDKQRNGNWTGKVAMWFHPSGRYTTSPGFRPNAVEPWRE